MRQFVVIFMLINLIGIGGCASPPRTTAPVEPEAAHTAPLSIPTEAIDEQIQSVETLLRRKDLTGEEKRLARYLLDTYRDIKKISQDRDLTLATYDLLVHSLFETLTYTEQALFEIVTSQHDPDLNAFFKMKNDILDAFLIHNYPYVVHACNRLKSLFGPKALTPNMAMLYAMALAEEGDLEEAITVGNSVVQKLDQLPDPVRLRAHMAQWALELGRKEQALAHYEILSDIQDQRAALIRRLDPGIQKDERASPEAAQHLPLTKKDHKAGLATFTRLDNLLEAVDAHLGKNQFQEAKLLLIRHQLTFEDPRKTEAMDRKLQKIKALEQEYEEERMIREAYVKETLAGAKRLLEAEKFEDAMDKLDEMEGDEEFMAESKALRERAVENIINQERNRAAKLFLQAKKTPDASKKEQLLQQSYEILKGMADKYPSSPLNKKILSHIDIVKEELSKMRE
ncbi:MAG: hypothetical protein R6U38_05870 [Desulfatiglandaceae bacterium]